MNSGVAVANQLVAIGSNECGAILIDVKEYTVHDGTELVIGGGEYGANQSVGQYLRRDVY